MPDLAEENRQLKLDNARLRDNYRRIAEAWNALSREVVTTAGQEPERLAPRVVTRQVVTAYQVAQFPYPREWELEDSLLRERAEKAEAKVGVLREALVRPIAPDDADMEFLARLPKRAAGDAEGEARWFRRLAEAGEFAQVAIEIVRMWEASRSESRLVREALAATEEERVGDA